MTQNKKGISLLGTLIVLAIVMTLTVMLLKNYQKNMTAVTGTPTAQQSVQDIRKAMQDIEKAAAQRAEREQNLYR